jgi:glycosyltransferase involved in cell wall biosynthesis
MLKFSVIVPNYNHSRFLRQRLDSILQQTYQHFELIILDDCSTDDSRQVIETYRSHPKISYILYNEKNSGSPFSQWKKGIEIASGNWIWIAESDDFADSSFLEMAAVSIENNPLIGLYYCDSFLVDASNKIAGLKYSERKNKIFNTAKWSSSYYNTGAEEINECLKFDCTINNTSSMVFKKTVISGNQNDIDGFIYYGDWCFFLKMSFIANIYYCSTPLNFFRKHDNGHLCSPTSPGISRQEYFRILKMLYYNEEVTEKMELVNHFTFYYLSFGLIKDGLMTGFIILKSYFKTDKKLFAIVLRELALIKFIRKKPKKFKVWYSDLSFD